MKARTLILEQEDFEGEIDKQEILGYVRPTTLWLGLVTDGDDDYPYASNTEEGLEKQIVQFCLRNKIPGLLRLPDDPTELIDTYFKNSCYALYTEEIQLRRQPADRKVWVAIARVEGEYEFLTGSSSPDLDLQLANWCLDHPTEGKMPAETDNPTPRDIVDAYFHWENDDSDKYSVYVVTIR